MMAVHKSKNPNNTIARIVGALFLFSNFTFILGAIVILEPIMGAPEYLTLAAASRNQVISGAFLEILNAVAYIFIAVLMYSVFKQRFAGMAMAYIAFRIIEFVMQTSSSLSAMSLVTLSEEFVAAEAPAAAAFQAAGTILLAERYWAFQMVSFSLVAGAVMLYTMLYQSKLIPRFISIWGLLGAVTVVTSTLLDIYAWPIGIGLGLVLGLPMLLNELFLGGWLIIKGFNSAADLTEPAQTEMRKVKLANL